jgi:hypothetical protein
MIKLETMEQIEVRILIARKIMEQHIMDIKIIHIQINNIISKIHFPLQTIEDIKKRLVGKILNKEIK